MLNKIYHSDNSRKLSEEEFFSIDLSEVYIVDVRNPFELSSGALQCAHNIPFSELLSLPTKLPKNKTILAYCNYGNRAGQAALALSKAGYNAYSLGGYTLFSQKLKNRCN
ncbi:MAG: rhodanese-like domain-containing protein [Brevinema sp.]